MKKLFVCGAFMLALSACKSGWTAEQKDAYLKPCISGLTATLGEEKAKAQCNCTEEKLEKKYPKEEDMNKMTAAELSEITKDCMK